MFPCNSAVLRGSLGVIVHSSHAIALARAWYGHEASSLMRQVPFLPFAPEATERDAALASPLAQGEGCLLIFVGENDTGEYGRRLLDRIASSGRAPRISITGYCEESRYRDYLAAADLAVQLRSTNRGETSAAIFDCLSHN